MQTDKITELEQRIENLESQLSFQDDTIESLNTALTTQQSQVMLMEAQLKAFAQKLKTLQPQDAVAALSDDTPPPHY